jgi:hypothetical protein
MTNKNIVQQDGVKRYVYNKVAWKIYIIIIHCHVDFEMT